MSELKKKSNNFSSPKVALNKINKVKRRREKELFLLSYQQDEHTHTSMVDGETPLFLLDRRESDFRAEQLR